MGAPIATRPKSNYILFFLWLLSQERCNHPCVHETSVGKTDVGIECV